MNEQNLKCTNELPAKELPIDWQEKFLDVAENGTHFENPFPNVGYASNTNDRWLWDAQYQEARTKYSQKLNAIESEKLRTEHKTENLLILGLRELERNNSSNNSIDLKKFINDLETLKKENNLTDLQIYTAMFFNCAKIMAKEI